jgi:pSer/pThr/pTyr-binding forkhead associated (FHA) protein
LVLDGRRNIDLASPVVTIGRGLDSDVILENPRVSRRHAQLRLRYDRYVLYDLGSRAGTRVNGYPVEECVLHSGDVLSFGGVQVVYGEDRTTTGRVQGFDDTPILPPEDGAAG